MKLGTVCVYGGARPGSEPVFLARARALGTTLGRRGLGVVYGGGHVGLMGAMADAAIEAGARVTGVIPSFLEEKEIAHRGLAELVVTADMHERKAEMLRRADAFVAMPGGMGTLEELFEVFTWGQLALHDRPIGLFDVALEAGGAFWDPLAALVEHLVRTRFVAPEHALLLVRESDPDALVDALERFVPPPPGDPAVDFRARGRA